MVDQIKCMFTFRCRRLGKKGESTSFVNQRPMHFIIDILSIFGCCLQKFIASLPSLTEQNWPSLIDLRLGKWKRIIRFAFGISPSSSKVSLSSDGARCETVASRFDLTGLVSSSSCQWRHKLSVESLNNMSRSSYWKSRVVTTYGKETHAIDDCLVKQWVVLSVPHIPQYDRP